MTPMKDNPAMRAAERIAGNPMFSSKHWQPETKAREAAAIIEQEYTTERRECVRVMKRAERRIAMSADYLPHDRAELLAQLRELIGKLVE